MNDSASDSPQAQDAALQNILQGVPRRPQPSAEARDRAYTILKEDWQQQLSKRRAVRQRRRLLQSVAGISVLGVLLWFTDIGVSGQWQAELATGEVTLDSVTYTAPLKLDIAADTSMTADGVSRLVLKNGAELRLSADTTVDWVDANQLYLKRGAAYVDTHQQANVVIQSQFGRVRDIGTRFMVMVGAEGLQVAVREGAAQVSAPSGTYEAVAEDQSAALVSLNRAGVTQSTEATSNPRWDWILEASPGYRARALPDLLNLIGKDLGKPVVYSSLGVEAIVAPVAVHGDLTHVRPRKALDLVTKSAGLSWREEKEKIVIDFNH